MPQVEIMNLCTISTTFPELDCDLVNRENILDTIDTVLSGEVNVLLIEGDDGLGKTHVLAQLAQRRSYSAASVFLSPVSRWYFNLELFRFDLCNQLSWFAFGEELAESSLATDSYLQRVMFDLAKVVKRKNMQFCFIIDGLDQVSKEDEQLLASILGVLPIGVPRFRFVIAAGSDERISAYLPEGVNRKSLPLSGFTFDEASLFLSHLNIAKPQLREIYKICHGVPGHLATVKRVIASGCDVGSLLEDFPEKVPHLFSLEWKSLENASEELLLAIAMLAFDAKSRSVDELAELVGLPREEILELVGKSTFLDVSERDKAVGFVSRPFRDFAAKKLERLQPLVHEVILNYLVQIPETVEALLFVPEHLEKLQRFDELFGYLTIDNISLMVDKFKSRHFVRQKIGAGVSASLVLKRDGELFRFALQRSIIGEIDNSRHWSSEVEARLALGGYESALELAHSAVLKEDRLLLLALIARSRREKGLSPEEPLVNEIRQSLQAISFPMLGDRAIEIAANLLPVLPDLATELVRRVATNARGDEALDSALATLSLKPPESKGGGSDGVKDDVDHGANETLAAYFKLQTSKQIARYSADDVIIESERISEVADRLYILRMWTRRHLRNPDALRVVEYAADLAIRAVEYAPTSGLFVDLLQPLPYSVDLEKVGRLVRYIDAQKVLLRRISPTAESLRLDLQLARCEEKFSPGSSAERLVSVFVEASSIRDLTVRASSFAGLYSTIKTMDSAEELEKREGLISMCAAELRDAVTQILDSSSYQFDSLAGTIRALAVSDLEMSRNISLRLNIEKHRDRGLLAAIVSSAQDLSKPSDLDGIIKCMNGMQGLVYRDEAVARFLEGAVENDSFVLHESPLVRRLIDLVGSIAAPGDRCEACLSIIEVLSRSGLLSDELKTRVLGILSAAWEGLSFDWVKIKLGFKAASELAVYDREGAGEYFEKTRRVSGDSLFRSGWVSRVYVQCIRLAIRAFSGLLPKGLHDDSDLQKLGSLIEGLSSPVERGMVWSEIALVMQRFGRREECRAIVRTRVRPLLANVKMESESMYRRMLRLTSVALYAAHSASALQELQDLDTRERDGALVDIFSFIVDKVGPWEPFSRHPAQVPDLSFEECLDLCAVIELVDADERIYRMIKEVSAAVGSKRGRQQLSQQQQLDIALKLENCISKLPHPRMIRHQGYVVACRAQILRMRRSSAKEWEVLVEGAKSIPNTADRAVSFGILAEASGGRDLSMGIALLREAEESVSRLPCAIDRINHFESLALVASSINVPSKPFLKLALVSALESDDPEDELHLTSLLDTAHSIDPQLASYLSSLIDDDPVRRAAKDASNRKEKSFSMRKRLLENGEFDPVDEKEVEVASEAAWRLLGSLNAGRVTPLKIERVRGLLDKASRAHFASGFELFSWLIQNLVVKYSKTDEAHKLFKPMFEATIHTAELIRKVLLTSVGREPGARSIDRVGASGSAYIRSGDRDEGISFIRHWLASSLVEYLKICDPFFGPRDLEVLKLILEINPSCRVYILSGRKHHHDKVSVPWNEAYRASWRRMMSDEDPPDTEISVVGLAGSGELPIHDRYWFTKGGGLRVGTSFESLGGNRDSEVGILDKFEAEIREAEADQYLQRLKREHQGRRVLYDTFSLYPSM